MRPFVPAVEELEDENHGVPLLVTLASFPPGARPAEASVEQVLEKIDVQRGVVGLLEVPRSDAHYPVRLAEASELTVYVQCARPSRAERVRRAAQSAGLLGERIFVAAGSLDAIHLATNVADCLLVAGQASASIADAELLRALRPQGIAWIGKRKLTKPIPPGLDQWTHPYHGPDNKPQSRDTLVRGALQTQFLGQPQFSPMPEQSVVAGARIFKAMDHIAHKANQNAMLNKLLCIHAYHGTIL